MKTEEHQHQVESPGTPMPKRLVYTRSLAFLSYEVRLHVGVTRNV
jgi:hypothetical protein